MIVDRLENCGKYDFGEAWKYAFDFLTSLDGDAEERKYRIRGDDIYASVMSYETKDPGPDDVLEAHRTYVDIQVVLGPPEGIEWAPIEGLDTVTEYDESRDVVFFSRALPGPGRINVYPGTFVVLFPQDAHRAQFVVDGTAEKIKKVVIKIRADLLTVKA